MEILDDLSSKDGWIITDTSNGKTKVAACGADETNPFNRTRQNWVVLDDIVEDRSSGVNILGRIMNSPFRELGNKYKQNRIGITHVFLDIVTNVFYVIGFFFIRDILNFHKVNSFTECFLADNIPLKKVILCARITSYERKNDYYRLILDDGTSSILCMLKIKEKEEKCQFYSESQEMSTNNIREESNENISLSWAITKISSHQNRLMENKYRKFDQNCLGSPIRISGYLHEYYGKNYIFAYNFHWISEEQLVKFLEYLVDLYEYKENYIFCT